MDVACAKARVRLGWLGFFSVLVLAGCGGRNDTNVSDIADAQKAQCQSQKIAKSYIVRWKDGSTTLEKADSDAAFIQEIAKPNAGKIQFSEHDYRVQLPKRPKLGVTERSLMATAPDDWGQQIVGAEQVWAQGVLGAGITVAVVDSGMDVTHPQLQGQLAVNAGEIPANGIDDDGNGLIDDVSGYDFNSNTAAVTDGAGHGTHVSGIIGADPTKGSVQGMAPKAKILPLRFMDDDGGGTLSNAIRALQYAQAQGAKIISASWGGADCSNALQLAVQELGSHGVLFVAAAGNGDSVGNGVNLDVTPEYPAALGLPLQITVAATTVRDIMAGFSNYSKDLVNIAAPGVSIVSTWPPDIASTDSPACAGKSVCTLDGTSMATPFVSAAAALIWSAHPSATAAQVRAAILTSVDVGNFPVSSGGRLNVQSALAKLGSVVP